MSSPNPGPEESPRSVVTDGQCGQRVKRVRPTSDVPHHPGTPNAPEPELSKPDEHDARHEHRGLNSCQASVSSDSERTVPFDSEYNPVVLRGPMPNLLPGAENMIKSAPDPVAMREFVAAFDAMARAANTSYKTISSDNFVLYKEVILKVNGLDSALNSLKKGNNEAITNLASTVREVQGQVCALVTAVGEAETRNQAEFSKLNTKIEQVLSKMNDSFSQTARDSMTGRGFLDQKLRNVQEDIQHGFKDNSDQFERLSAIHRRGEEDTLNMRKAALDIQSDAFQMRKIVSEAHQIISDLQQEGRDLNAGFGEKLDQFEEVSKSLLSVLTMRRTRRLILKAPPPPDSQKMPCEDGPETETGDGGGETARLLDASSDEAAPEDGDVDETAGPSATKRALDHEQTNKPADEQEGRSGAKRSRTTRALRRPLRGD